MLLAFAATLVLGGILLLFFDPSVQQASAEELARRSGDARAFLIADLFFIVLYAVVSPVAWLRFGRARTVRAPVWIVLAAMLAFAGGAVDALENALLLSATGSRSGSAVDTAHSLAPFKVGLFVAAGLLGLAVVVQSAIALRRD